MNYCYINFGGMNRNWVAGVQERVIFHYISRYIFKIFVSRKHNPIQNHYYFFKLNNNHHHGYPGGMKVRISCGIEFPTRSQYQSRLPWGIRESHRPEKLPAPKPLRLVTQGFNSERERVMRGQSWPSQPESRRQLSHIAKSIFYFYPVYSAFTWLTREGHF